MMGNDLVAPDTVISVDTLNQQFQCSAYQRIEAWSDRSQAGKCGCTHADVIPPCDRDILRDSNPPLMKCAKYANRRQVIATHKSIEANSCIKRLADRRGGAHRADIGRRDQKTGIDRDPGLFEGFLIPRDPEPRSLRELPILMPDKTDSRPP